MGVVWSFGGEWAGGRGAIAVRLSSSVSESAEYQCSSPGI